MTKEDDIPEISKRLRDLRKNNGLSQRALAKLAGVTSPAITLWETGQRFPRGKNLKKLAAALGVSESDILGGTPEGDFENVSKDSILVSLFKILPTFNQKQLRTVLALANQLAGLTRADSAEDIG